MPCMWLSYCFFEDSVSLVDLFIYSAFPSLGMPLISSWFEARIASSIIILSCSGVVPYYPLLALAWMPYPPIVSPFMFLFLALAWRLE